MRTSHHPQPSNSSSASKYITKLVDANIRAGTLACIWCIKSHAAKKMALAFNKWKSNSLSSEQSRHSVSNVVGEAIALINKMRLINPAVKYTGDLVSGSFNAILDPVGGSLRNQIVNSAAEVPNRHLYITSDNIHSSVNPGNIVAQISTRPSANHGSRFDSLQLTDVSAKESSNIGPNTNSDDRPIFAGTSTNTSTSGVVLFPWSTRLHDDTSTYTGVHRTGGGPTVVDADKRSLASLVDRSVSPNNSPKNRSTSSPPTASATAGASVKPRGPTIPEPTRLHDDFSLYTGVYKRRNRSPVRFESVLAERNGRHQQQQHSRLSARSISPTYNRSRTRTGTSSGVSGVQREEQRDDDASLRATPRHGSNDHSVNEEGEGRGYSQTGSSSSSNNAGPDGRGGGGASRPVSRSVSPTSKARGNNRYLRVGVGSNAHHMDDFSSVGTKYTSSQHSFERYQPVFRSTESKLMSGLLSSRSHPLKHSSSNSEAAGSASRHRYDSNDKKLSLRPDLSSSTRHYHYDNDNNGEVDEEENSSTPAHQFNNRDIHKQQQQQLDDKSSGARVSKLNPQDDLKSLLSGGDADDSQVSLDHPGLASVLQFMDGNTSHDDEWYRSIILSTGFGRTAPVRTSLQTAQIAAAQVQVDAVNVHSGGGDGGGAGVSTGVSTIGTVSGDPLNGKSRSASTQTAPPRQLPVPTTTGRGSNTKSTTRSNSPPRSKANPTGNPAPVVTPAAAASSPTTGSLHREEVQPLFRRRVSPWLATQPAPPLPITAAAIAPPTNSAKRADYDRNSGSNNKQVNNNVPPFSDRSARRPESSDDDDGTTGHSRSKSPATRASFDADDNDDDASFNIASEYGGHGEGESKNAQQFPVKQDNRYAGNGLSSSFPQPVQLDGPSNNIFGFSHYNEQTTLNPMFLQRQSEADLHKMMHTGRYSDISAPSTFSRHPHSSISSNGGGGGGVGGGRVNGNSGNGSVASKRRAAVGVQSTSADSSSTNHKKGLSSSSTATAAKKNAHAHAASGGGGFETRLERAQFKLIYGHDADQEEYKLAWVNTLRKQRSQQHR